MARILVTGASGFSARSLLRLLVAEGAHEVLGIGRHGLDTESEAGWHYEFADLLDADSVRGALRGFAPEWVFHLAGAKSGSLPELYGANLLGSQNLLDALAAEVEPARTRILFIGSAAEYGLSGSDGAPVSERALLQPVSGYAFSKVLQVVLGLQYAAQAGWPVVVARPFNLIGPGQDTDMVAGSWARQVARIEQGLETPVLRVQGLDAARDFVDIRDAVRAYRILVERGQSGECYNIASGQAISLERLLQIFRALSKVPFEVECVAQAAPGRDVDASVLCGDSAKLNALADWNPQIGLKQSVSDLLEEQRHNLA